MKTIQAVTETVCRVQWCRQLLRQCSNLSCELQKQEDQQLINSQNPEMNTHGQEDTEHPATPSSSASSTLHRDQRQRAGSTPPPPHRPAPDNGGPPPPADPVPPPPLRPREEEEEEDGGRKRRILGADIQPKKGQKIVDRKCSLCKRLFKYPRQTTWISDTFKLISKDVFCLE